MPFLFVLAATGLVLVVTTGAVLDRTNVRRSRRVLIFAGIFLLPVLLLFLLLFLLGPFKWPC
jgi:hypothetical protein